MIKPTVGRKLYYWPVNEPAIEQIDPRQPCDATLLFPWSDTCVNLSIIDHQGRVHVRTSVFLHQGDGPFPGDYSHAAWMPYQTGQAKAAA